MSDDVLKTYISEYIATCVQKGQTDIEFVWQGGEPTMLGVPYFEKIVEYQTEYRPNGVSVSNAVQTNGMLINDRWGAFLKENDFLVGVSLDGPKKIHDAYRVDRAGRPTFDAVMQGVNTLQKWGVKLNVLTTVHKKNAAKGKEVYRFLKSAGFDFIQFIPIVERTSATGHLASAPQIDMDPENNVSHWSVGSLAYGKFLCDVFDEWYRRDIGKVFVQHFESQIGQWSGHGQSLCIFAETCGNCLALEHNGDVFACDHYVYPEYRLGRLGETSFDDMVSLEKQVTFGLDKRDGLTKQCKACKFRFACNGGCPKHRFVESNTGEPGHNYFCKGYTKFYRHTEARLSELAMQLALTV